MFDAVKRCGKVILSRHRRYTMWYFDRCFQRHSIDQKVHIITWLKRTRQLILFLFVFSYQVLSNEKGMIIQEN